MGVNFHGEAWHGTARQGEARRGKANNTKDVKTMAAILTDGEPKQRKARAYNAELERIQIRQAILVCVMIAVAFGLGLSLGYFGGAVRCEQVIRQNTAEAK